MSGVVIIGGGHLAVSLRAEGYMGPITLIDAGGEPLSQAAPLEDHSQGC